LDKKQQNGCQNLLDINTIIQKSNLMESSVSVGNVKVSFMVFRTGSVLIVGKCDEDVLMIIYEFLKRILHNEFNNICQKKNKMELEEENCIISKDKNKKIRKKNIIINTSI
jgi:hypothetical protein